MQIAPLLKIGRGVTALIGGGGKTTLLYALAEELRGRGRVIVCTSTHIRMPEQYPLMTGDAEALRVALDKENVVCAGTPAEDGKLTAPAASFEELSALADYVLQNHRREVVLGDQPPLLVYESKPLAGTIEHDTHVGMATDDYALALVHPRLVSIWVQATEVRNWLVMNGQHLASHALEQLASVSATRAMHGIKHDLEVR